MTTRELAKFEYEKAVRQSLEIATLILTAAGAAGWLLAAADGDVDRAVALSPTGKFWTEKVRHVLQAIKREETT